MAQLQQKRRALSSSPLDQFISICTDPITREVPTLDPAPRGLHSNICHTNISLATSLKVCAPARIVLSFRLTCAQVGRMPLVG